MANVKVRPQGGAAEHVSQAAMDQQTPTQKILAEAAQPFSKIDALGRTIVLKKPGVLDQFRLIEALGETAKNDVYRVMCIPMIYVVSIDGLPVPTLSNKPQIEALITRLGAEGFAAIDEAIKEKYQAPSDEGDEAIKK